jgi:hypothetical protein
MLSLVFTIAALTAPATPADGTYTYVSSVNGAPVGKTSITVTHATTGLVLAEKGAGSYNGESGTIEDTLNLDGTTLAPSSYTASAIFGDRPMKASVTFNATSATQTGDVGTKTYDLVADAKHFVVLDIGPFSGWFALPAQMVAWNDAPALAIAPAFGHGFPLVATNQTPARPQNVPATDASIAVTQPVPFTVWYDPKTLVVDRVEIPTQGVIVTRQA